MEHRGVRGCFGADGGNLRRVRGVGGTRHWDRGKLRRSCDAGMVRRRDALVFVCVALVSKVGALGRCEDTSAVHSITTTINRARVGMRRRATQVAVKEDNAIRRAVRIIVREDGAVGNRLRTLSGCRLWIGILPGSTGGGKETTINRARSARRRAAQGTIEEGGTYRRGGWIIVRENVKVWRRRFGCEDDAVEGDALFVIRSDGLCRNGQRWVTRIAVCARHRDAQICICVQSQEGQ